VIRAHRLPRRQVVDGHPETVGAQPRPEPGRSSPEPGRSLLVAARVVTEQVERFDAGKYGARG
jgi:hypothetical protein